MLVHAPAQLLRHSRWAGHRLGLLVQLSAEGRQDRQGQRLQGRGNNLAQAPTLLSPIQIWKKPIQKSSRVILRFCDGRVISPHSVLFDIESFDYGYYDEGSEGLKVAVVHHLDMPIIRQRAFHVAPGTENQIPVTPTLYTATEQVRWMKEVPVTPTWYTATDQVRWMKEVFT